MNSGQEIRDALVQCELFLGNVDRHGHQTLNEGDKCVACVGAAELRDQVNKALARPRRNCDVGTPAEQEERFARFCHRESGGTCLGCPIVPITDCGIVWANMPYEEAEDGR